MNLSKFFLSVGMSMFILVAGHLRLRAQNFDEINFTSYTKQEGLSNSFVTGIVQDARGYMWIATAAGLNRFNGSNFVQFHSSDDTLSLPQESLTGLVWLDGYRLAVYSSGGLHIVNTGTGETHNLLVSYKDKQYQYK